MWTAISCRVHEMPAYQKASNGSRGVATHMAGTGLIWSTTAIGRPLVVTSEGVAIDTAIREASGAGRPGYQTTNGRADRTAVVIVTIPLMPVS